MEMCAVCGKNKATQRIAIKGKISYVCENCFRNIDNGTIIIEPVPDN